MEPQQKLKVIKDLELDHVNAKIAKGKVYAYFRPAGTKPIALPTDDITELKRAHAALLNALNAKPEPKKPTPVVRIVPSTGTIGQAIVRFKSSTTYISLKPKTKLCYERSLDDINQAIGAGLLADLDTDAIDIHTEEIAKEKGFSTADRHVRLLSSIWQEVKKYPEYGIKGKLNPCEDAALRYTVKSPSKPWSDDQQDRFMETAPAHLQLGKLLLHFSAQRGGDCVAMLWTQFDGKGLWVTPEKTDANPDPLPNYHLCPKPLREALLAAQPNATAETILTSSYGTPWSSSMALSRAIRDHLVRIGLAKRGQKTISMHGLRKTAASQVAELLVGAAGVKTVTGHRSDEMADYYAQHANRLQMNRMVVEKWDDAIEEKRRATKRRAAGIRRVK